MKIYVEDGQTDATIHLSGKDISILETIRKEIELFERFYPLEDAKVYYLAGPKF